MKKQRTKSDAPIYKGVPEQFNASENIPTKEEAVEKEQGMSESQKTLHRQALRFISKRT